MLNPNNHKHLARIRNAIVQSRRTLKPYRDNRKQFIKHYAGTAWGENTQGKDTTSRRRTAVNMLELMVNIYVRSLAARAPKALVTSSHGDLKANAVETQLALNHFIKQIDLETIFRKVVTDAMFGMGIMRMGICGYEEDKHGYLVDPGQVFSEAVSLDDWVHDTNARELERCVYMGSRYRMRAEEVRKSKSMNREARIAAANNAHEGGYDDFLTGEKTAHDLGGTAPHDHQDPLVRYVEMWDLWLPQEGLLVTLTERDSAKPLRVVEWEGPETGPYRLLRYSHVPDNVMPLAPAATMYELSEIINRLYVKMARQAERQKSIVLYRGTAEDDAKRIKRGEDGEVLRSDAPGDVNEVKFGGVAQENHALAADLINRFVYGAGNLDSIGGLAAQSETFKQDQLLAQNASKRIVDMQDQTEKFARESIRDVAYYLISDPYIELPLIQRMPEIGIDIPFTWKGETNPGDYLDYNFEIELGSMQHQSPGEKAASIVQTLNILAPHIPAMAQQGNQIDYSALVKHLSDYQSLPELLDIIKISTPQFEMPPIGSAPQKDKQQQHVTEQRSGQTRQGQDTLAMTGLPNQQQGQPQQNGAAV